MAGMSEDRAEAWVAAWEAEAVPRGLPRGDRFWKLGFDWIATEREVRRLPG